MNLSRQKMLFYKALNKLNPGDMDDIFKIRNMDRLTREKI